MLASNLWRRFLAPVSGACVVGLRLLTQLLLAKTKGAAVKKCSVIVSECVMRVTEQLAAVPRLANLGPLFKSSHSPVELTESETEYIVRCIKHTFPHHVVFQVHSLAALSLVLSSRPVLASCLNYA